LTLEPWPAAAVKQARSEAPRDVGRVRGYELAIRQVPFDLPRASYPCAVAGCGAGGNFFDPEDWCDVFATESVYMRSGCVAMALGAQRPAHCPLKVDHGRQEANLGGVGGGVCGCELAVRQVPFERLSVSYLCAVAGSVLVVMSLIPDIVATPLPGRTAPKGGERLTSCEAC
jgi:hypothetical protein